MAAFVQTGEMFVNLDMVFKVELDPDKRRTAVTLYFGQGARGTQTLHDEAAQAVLHALKNPCLHVV